MSDKYSTLTQARIREVLHYSRSTGVFTWKVSKGRNAQPGREAGTLNAQGYVAIMIDQHLYPAHRLAWCYVHGHWPKHLIDHKNGIRTDNRLRNLRDVTNQMNLHNSKVPYSNNKVGLRGVSFEPRNNKWYSRIYVNGKGVALGWFTTPEAAHAAYLKAKRKFHFK